MCLEGLVLSEKYVQEISRFVVSINYIKAHMQSIEIYLLTFCIIVYIVPII